MKKHWYFLLFFIALGTTATYAQFDASAPPTPKSPQSLDWRPIHGDKVLLLWDAPEVGESNLEGYEIYRSKRTVPPEYKFIANVNKTRQFEDLRVKVGDQFDYLVSAKYLDDSNGNSYISVDVPYPEQVTFRSIPPPTGKVNEIYQYEIDLEYNRNNSLYFEIINNPGNAVVQITQDAPPILTWEPTTPGVYEFSLVANVIKNGSDTSRALQEVQVIVSETYGTVNGYLQSIKGERIPFGYVQFFVSPNESDDVKFKLQTDENGEFEIESFPTGVFIAYAHPGTDQYIPRYYSRSALGRTIDEAEVIELFANESVLLPFTMLENTNTEGIVHGVVRNEEGGFLESANVHFIRKNKFINIGDRNTQNNPASIESWKQTKIDTTVVTNLNGEFQAFLPVGEHFYIVVEKDGYYDCYNDDAVVNTNALLARSFKVETSGFSVNYGMTEKTEQLHTISGQVKSDGSQANKSAVIFLIEESIKQNRGAGNGGFYSRIRSIITDSNGVYLFEDVPMTSSGYVLLAVPMDRDVIPTYYSTSIGNLALTLDESDRIFIQNTLQGFDFNLQPANNKGVGTVYGRVAIINEKDEYTFIAGSLVYAIDSENNIVAGYAISDSLGFYSIPGVPPGRYTVVADHPQYGADDVTDVPIVYSSLTDPGKSVSVNLFIPYKSPVSTHNPNIVPNAIELYQNFPNPFNPTTNIKFGLDRRTTIKLVVLNSLGQEVRVVEEGEFQAGTHTTTFDATNLPSGMYFYQLKGNGKILSKSMMLVK